ncbi:MAG: ATP-binding protein [Bacteroidetes bacterium]|nr:ATP-binding protein [Bacteroidota bacterium]
MAWFKRKNNGTAGNSILNRYARVRSSIYGQVVYVITLLTIFLFVSFGIIFWSVNEKYMKSVIHQSGNNVGFLVQGALYHSMLENDKKALQNTLDIINTLSGIDEVNMYDSKDSLIYSSFSFDTIHHSNPNCKHCHSNLATMFPRKEKTYRIISARSECTMNQNDNSHRHLLIRTPILNEKSCYLSSCHAHNKNDDILGSLVIKIPLESLDATLTKSSTDFFLLASLTTLLLVTFLILFTNRKIKRPLNAIIRASEAVARGDRSTRLEIKPNQLDDMRMMSIAFNDMLDNLQTATNELHNWSQQLEYKVQKKSEELGEVQHELIKIERIASLGKLSLSVAHEINNPLSGILIYTKLVSKQLLNQAIEPVKKENILKNLTLIENETKRCGDIVKGLLDFSRKDQNDYEPRHIHEVLRETYDLMTHPMKIANISFIADLSARSDLVFCSPNQIKQACIALLVNASEAIGAQGEITIKTSNPDEKNLKVEIIDNGTGIDAEALPHIFEPFFSTKQSSSGIGLGLSIVHGIVDSHKGKTGVKSEPGKGTTISITLPLIKEQGRINDEKNININR